MQYSTAELYIETPIKQEVYFIIKKTKKQQITWGKRTGGITKKWRRND